MNLFLIGFSFLITAFAQPAWVRGLGPLCAAFGFALFWKGMISYERPRDRFLLSLLWFASIQAVQLSWMTSVKYMGSLMLLVYLFLILGLGVQFAILSFFFKENRLDWRSCLAISGCWVIFEWLRLFFLCGFTWNPVGLSLADSSYSLQLASLFGIFGLSFWVIFVNLAAFKALVEKSSRQATIWACLAFLPYLFGLVHQNFVERMIPPGKSLNVALIQTGLFPEQKDRLDEDPTAYIAPVAQWERILNVLDTEKQLDLIVLPEAALPLGAHRAGYKLAAIQKYFPKECLPALERPFAIFDKDEWRVSNVFLAQALANKFHAHVIVGLDDADFTGKYNAAFHFHPENPLYERYEKRVLVPMGEYVPLRDWKFFSEFAARQFGIYSSFDAGVEAKIFNAGCPIGVSICLEETFSGLTRDLRLKGAELFVNLTNDVWFPGSKLPQQHFDHGRVRAAENGVSILRSCNTGITGWVDCFGRSMAQLPTSEKEASALYLKVPTRSYSTLYSWWGDQAILGISGLSFVAYFLFRKKKLL